MLIHPRTGCKQLEVAVFLPHHADANLGIDKSRIKRYIIGNTKPTVRQTERAWLSRLCSTCRGFHDAGCPSVSSNPFPLRPPRSVSLGVANQWQLGCRRKPGMSNGTNHTVF